MIGRIRPTSHAEAVERARSMLGPAVLPVVFGSTEKPPRRYPLRYRLEWPHNGGLDPNAPHPGAVSYNALWTADCIGFVAWCLGFSRKQPDYFRPHGGSCNTDAVVADAKGPRDFFAPVDRPEPGDVVVYGSTYLLGVRVKVGHIGLVSSPLLDPDNPWSCRVIDCSSSQSKALGWAVTERSDARVWRKGRALRYVRAV